MSDSNQGRFTKFFEFRKSLNVEINKEKVSHGVALELSVVDKNFVLKVHTLFLQKVDKSRIRATPFKDIFGQENDVFKL